MITWLTHLVNHVLQELVHRIPLHSTVQGMQKIQHTRRNNCLLHGVTMRKWHALLEVVVRIGLILQRTTRQPWKLSMVALSKIAKYCPSAARLDARPLPPGVSMIGYVANEEARCSPSVTSISPVLAMFDSESSVALYCARMRSSCWILPAS